VSEPLPVVCGHVKTERLAAIARYVTCFSRMPTSTNSMIGGICFELQDTKDSKSHLMNSLDSAPIAYVHLKACKLRPYIHHLLISVAVRTSLPRRHVPILLRAWQSHTKALLLAKRRSQSCFRPIYTSHT
jgi:hypothetical protein